MAGPVSKFVQRGAVVPCCISEGFLLREVNAIPTPAVECTIGLVVQDLCARVLEDLLAGLYDFEGWPFPWSMRRYSINLGRVENRVYPVNETRAIAIPLMVNRGS